jgi:hypothetical protein
MRELTHLRVAFSELPNWVSLVGVADGRCRSTTELTATSTRGQLGRSRRVDHERPERSDTVPKDEDSAGCRLGLLTSHHLVERTLKSPAFSPRSSRQSSMCMWMWTRRARCWWHNDSHRVVTPLVLLGRLGGRRFRRGGLAAVDARRTSRGSILTVELQTFAGLLARSCASEMS